MKNNRKIIGIIAVIIFVVGVIVFAFSNPKVTSAPTGNGTYGQPSDTSTNTTGTTSTTTKSSTYTLADVAKHNGVSSCWTTINGGVYDVTSWINQHPGGRDAILSLCGKDGSSAFINQHGGQARPEAELASFKIGTLIK
jgi:cytochrome b involved in lipid metabolism